MTINTAMLVGLGFLVATLIAVLIAPAYRRRTIRLTTEALKRSLPLTEQELRAEKDRLRARHAITVHNLEAKLESVTLDSARQKIEVNRRDARISELEGESGRYRSAIEELENARHVLEQTVTDRLPKLESRLNEAKSLLIQRDREITALADTAQKQARALAEASQINQQQSHEIGRLNAALATRAVRNHDSLGDARFDGEVALRSEIEALRAKTRDQAALIERLQEVVVTPAGQLTPEVAAAVSTAVAAVQAANRGVEDVEVTRLKARLDETEAALTATLTNAEAERADNTRAGDELRRLRVENRDAAAEVARLKAALSAYEMREGEQRLRESPVSVKAKVSSLEAEVKEQAATIDALRAEAAALNERLVRQAAHYMDEIKRLNAGTLPASGEARNRGAATAPAAEAPRKSLAERIGEPRVVRLTPLAEKRAAEGGSAEPKPGAPVALFETLDVAAAQPSEPAEPAAPASKPEPPPRRPRLLERITNIEKS